MSAPSGSGPIEYRTIAALRRRQARRAWTTIGLAMLTFLSSCGLLFGAGYWYRGHATEKRTVRIEVVQGNRAFVRPAYQRNWNAVPTSNGSDVAPLELQEGDAFQTGTGTQALLTFWDNSRVQVFENTELQMTELRTTRYISQSSAVTMQQLRGSSRVALAPGDYRRARFQVEAGDATVLMKEGDGVTGGVFVVQVLPGEIGNALDAVSVRALVRRGIGAVRVAGQPGELRLDANEQTLVPPGGPAGAPTSARRDFVANSQFAPLGATGCDLGNQFAPWRPSCTPGQLEGSFGRLTTVSDTIDGQPVTALEIARSTSSTDSANTGVRQSLDVSVGDQPSLSLTADIKVEEQTLSGGGQSGTEFPMIVRINYYDAAGGYNTRIWTFYIVPSADGRLPFNASLVEARLVNTNEWVPLRFDLLGLVPQPVRLDSIEIYASGQGYGARITNVAIIGVE